MKKGMFFIILTFLLFEIQNAAASFSLNAVSANDSMLVIVKKGLMEGNKISTYQKSAPTLIYTAIPDTTRDIIIIYRRNYSENSLNLVAKERIELLNRECTLNKNYLLIKPYVNTIFNCWKSLV